MNVLFESLHLKAVTFTFELILSPFQILLAVTANGDENDVNNPFA